MSRWWCSVAVRVLASAVVVAVIHLQTPSHYIKAVEVSHRRRSLIDIVVFEEAEALWFASLFVVNEAEADYTSYATKDLADLLFAYT